MSTLPYEGSNAIVAVAQFYAHALGEMKAELDELRRAQPVIDALHAFMAKSGEESYDARLDGLLRTYFVVYGRSRRVVAGGDAARQEPVRAEDVRPGDGRG